MPELWKLVEGVVGQPLGRGARRLLLGLGTFAGTFLALTGLHIAFPRIALGLSLGVAGVMGGIVATLGMPPRTPRGTVGFLVALDPETEGLAAQVRNDFVDELRRYADKLALERPLKIVEWRGELARSVRDLDSAQQAMRESGCDLALFGHPRVRAGRHVFEPRIAVGHKPIPRAQSIALSEEVGRTLPKYFVIEGEGNFLGYGL